MLFKLIDFLQEYNGAATAVATAVIAAFTVVLATVNLRQVKLARQEFTATHRPRLVVRAIEGPLERNDRTVAFLTIANNGETDAIIVGHGLDLIYWPVGGDAPHASNVAAMQPCTLRSGQRQTFEVGSPQELTGRGAFQEAAGTHALYLYGIIRYQDTNGIEREIGLCRMYDATRGNFVPRMEYEYQD